MCAVGETSSGGPDRVHAAQVHEHDRSHTSRLKAHLVRHLNNVMHPWQLANHASTSLTSLGIGAEVIVPQKARWAASPARRADRDPCGVLPRAARARRRLCRQAYQLGIWRHAAASASWPIDDDKEKESIEPPGQWGPVGTAGRSCPFKRNARNARSWTAIAPHHAVLNRRSDRPNTVMQRRRVLFPDPLLPMMARTSPALASRSMP